MKKEACMCDLCGKEISSNFNIVPFIANFVDKNGEIKVFIIKLTLAHFQDLTNSPAGKGVDFHLTRFASAPKEYDICEDCWDKLVLPSEKKAVLSLEKSAVTFGEMFDWEKVIESAQKKLKEGSEND